MKVLDAEITFHAVALIFNLCVSQYALYCVDFSKTNDPLVLEMKQFQYRYLTTWNWITQFIYLCISLTHDILKKYLKWNQTIEWKLQQWKSYIFIAFVYPMTVTVGLMFWALYVLNREWVLPKASDVVFPSWYNHCVHTYILLFLIMETLLSDQQLPSFRSAFTGVSFIMLVYYTVFFYTYIEKRRWLYGLFYALNWYEMIIYMLFSYTTGILCMKLGFDVQTFKRKAIKAHL